MFETMTMRRRKSILGMEEPHKKALLALDMFPKVDAALFKARATAGAGLLLVSAGDCQKSAH